MKTISIAGQGFNVSEPYVAGHVLNEIEAKVLNQTRAENIGNNYRKMVKDAGDDAAKLAEATAAIAKADVEYQFAAGGIARTPVDPIDAEALRIAKDILKDKIADKFKTSVKKYLEIEGNQDKYDKNLDALVVREDVVKLAKQRVNAKQKVKDAEDTSLDV